MADVDAWNSALDASTNCDSAFLSHAYACAAEDVGFDVRVTVARNADGRPEGFLVYQRRTGLEGFFGIGERAAGSMTDYFSPVLTVSAEGSLVMEDFLEQTGLALFEISHAPKRASGQLKNVEDDGGGPVTQMPDGFEKWWAWYSEERESRARDLGRRRRKIEREFGPLQFSLDAGRSPALLEEIIEEKRRQYRQRSVSDALSDDRSTRLIHRLAAEEDKRCRILVSTLHAGDSWAASHIGLQCNSALHYWFPVFNDELKRASPGRLLILEMLRAMSKDGLSLLDYGQGESRTKMEFANNVRPFVKGIWRSNGPRGLAAQAMLSINWRLG